jgi:hypothetical protein
MHQIKTRKVSEIGHVTRLPAGKVYFGVTKAPKPNKIETLIKKVHALNLLLCTISQETFKFTYSAEVLSMLVYSWDGESMG